MTVNEVIKNYESYLDDLKDRIDKIECNDFGDAAESELKLYLEEIENTPEFLAMSYEEAEKEREKQQKIIEAYFAGCNAMFAIYKDFIKTELEDIKDFALYDTQLNSDKAADVMQALYKNVDMILKTA